MPLESVNHVDICNNCGYPINDVQSQFCVKCGVPIIESLNEKNQGFHPLNPTRERTRNSETSKKYAHIPLVADGSTKRPTLSDEKITFDTIETIPLRKNTSKRFIQETRCTCSACGKIWYYGKTEALSDFAAKTRNAGKNIAGCSCCCWPMYYMSREKTGLNECPSCGSKAVKKEQITHEVE